MPKTFYGVKLIPPRPDFVQTMTDDERNIMQQHGAYWRKYMEKGTVHVFGPVFDPKGAYGFGVVSVENEDELKEFINNDPSLVFNTVEYYPMLAVIAEQKV
ncbi:MAG: hypothetical protein ICV66_01385 [Chitinophagaceae bacterium]|nr:hypothetical protein [Chitinophagaceae bacterium]